jgi:hypothetical protein
MTRERWMALAVGIITVMVTLIVLALFERQAASKVQVDCMDPTERERVRDIVVKGIDQGLEKSITHLFDIWQKDPENAQPKRAMVGTNNAVNAHVRARKQALAWEPPHCEESP